MHWSIILLTLSPSTFTHFSYIGTNLKNFVAAVFGLFDSQPLTSSSFHFLSNRSTRCCVSCPSKWSAVRRDIQDVIVTSHWGLRTNDCCHRFTGNFWTIQPEVCGAYVPYTVSRLYEYLSNRRRKPRPNKDRRTDRHTWWHKKPEMACTVLLLFLLVMMMMTNNSHQLLFGHQTCNACIYTFTHSYIIHTYIHTHMHARTHTHKHVFCFRHVSYLPNISLIHIKLFHIQASLFP